MKYMLFSMMMSLVLLTTAHAQTVDRQVVASSGQYFENASFSVQATIGETVTTTASNGGILLTQGFQQPDSFITVQIQDIAITLGYKLFPNPASQIIKLYLTSDKNVALTYQLLDALGKNVSTPKTITFNTSHEENIDIQQLESGQYTLHLQDFSGKYLKAIHLQKIK